MKSMGYKTMRFLGVIMVIILLPMVVFPQQVIKFKSGKKAVVNILYESQDTVRYELVAQPGVTKTVLMGEIESISTYSPPQDHHASWQVKYERNRKVMFAGLGLCVVGAAVDVAGIVRIIKGEHMDYPPEGYSEKGAILTAVGIPMMIAGSIIATVGGGQMTKYSDRMGGFSLGLKATPGMTGITLRYGF